MTTFKKRRPNKTGAEKRPWRFSELVYRDGKRKPTPKVRKQYELWRSEQNPPLPPRCDNYNCKFHTQPLIWNGQELKLILDHENGVNTDNRPKNLRFLCPNCDSQQTQTRGGANKGRVDKESGGFRIKCKKTQKYRYVMPIDRGKHTIKFRNEG